ncbi:hypothetical protein [Nonomuraea roseoviolacea]|uniref:WXG100 family type VII secretion target n=1 Tax=Nonomuraea roseoviolacea subsp. carminata TaxID=160689 RepID=A0ABT1JWH5_9ACTN|nr:hypothetical protein [Nonomuraea roseoviolacea]MCP2345940.1 hypothetical protein [Nonomuraea roseoviolacea subsp. carminata]
MPARDHRHCGQKWPGLDADHELLEHPEDPKKKFQELADQLTAELTALTGMKHGGVQDVQAKASLENLRSQVQGIKRWDGGKVFVETAQRGQEQLTDIYGQVNEKLRIAIDLIKVGGGIYDKANDLSSWNA